MKKRTAKHERHHEALHVRRAPATGEWRACRLTDDGCVILESWPLHPDDAAYLERLYQSSLSRAITSIIEEVLHG